MATRWGAPAGGWECLDAELACSASCALDGGFLMTAIDRKLIQLLGSDDLELRKAAVRVLPEVGLQSKSATRALARALEDADDDLRLLALNGLARMGAKDVAHAVVPLILSSGPLREQAMVVISAIGQPVIPQLRVLFPESDFHGKRAIISTLARIGTKPAIAFLLEILPGEPFELQKHLTIHVCEALDRLPPAVHSQLFPIVQRLLRAKKSAENPNTLSTSAIIMGHFRGPRLATKARALLRTVATGNYPPEVRRYALVAFNRLVAEAKLSQPEEQFLFRMLADDDWHNIAQHALSALQGAVFARTKAPRLIELLRESPHFSVHIHVFERLQEIDRADVAESILPFLADSRFRVREAAEAALRRMPSAIESLFNVLVSSSDLEVTQRVNSILRDFPHETRRKYVDRACVRLLALFDQNDPHHRSFLDFVRSVDAEPLRKRIYEKASKLKSGRRGDRWERIVGYIELLWDNHLINKEGRYLLAVAHVKLSQKDLAPASRRANLGLQVIRALIYDDGAALIRRLKADKDLKAEDYFYLGFHFSEEGDEMKPFAMAMLSHVLRKYPKTKVASPAANKLAALEKPEDESPPARRRKKKSEQGKTGEKKKLERKKTEVPSGAARSKPGSKSKSKKSAGTASSSQRRTTKPISIKKASKAAKGATKSSGAKKSAKATAKKSAKKTTRGGKSRAAKASSAKSGKKPAKKKNRPQSRKKAAKKPAKRKK